MIMFLMLLMKLKKFIIIILINMNDWILKKVVSEKTDSGVSYFRAVYNNGINELDEFFEHG